MKEKLKKLGFEYTVIFSSIVLKNTYTNIEYKFQTWDQINYFLDGFEQGISKLLGDKLQDWFNQHQHPTASGPTSPIPPGGYFQYSNTIIGSVGIASTVTGIFGQSPIVWGKL